MPQVLHNNRRERESTKRLKTWLCILMKCEITGQAIQTTFLDKPLGTCIKDANGKKHWISSKAQASFNTKEQILQEIQKKK